jgi:hypothetical protein
MAVLFSTKNTQSIVLLYVIAGRYKNPTSVFTDKDFDSWDDKVVPYLDANRHDIHKYVSVMSDLKIQYLEHTSEWVGVRKVLLAK